MPVPVESAVRAALEPYNKRIRLVLDKAFKAYLAKRGGGNVYKRTDSADIFDSVIQAALAEAGAAHLANLDTVLARGYEDGTDLSGGQWQRIALARALCAVAGGARVVLLDEPTAQLDVRGEAEIFDRVLAATRRATTILISHRFSTVRHADRICVLENGAVVEIGTHDELMAAGGRYRTMFDLQAARFGDRTAEEALDVLD